MGYRLRTNNVNAIGHLIEGNVSTFLDHLLLDDEVFDSAIDYFNQFLSEKSTDFISSNQRRFDRRISELNRAWRKVKEELYTLKYENDQNDDRRRILLRYFKDLSSLLGSYELKFLILPGFENNELNSYLVNEENLKQWLSYESFLSYLIIQLKENPNSNEFNVFDSFEHYPLALDRIDEWPGVLIWENYRFPTFKREKNPSRGVFVPIQNKKDLNRIFEKLSFEKYFFNSILKEFGNSRNNNIVDIIHLSDIHVGSKNEELKHRRLFHILENHKMKYHGREKILTLISGDLVDSPNEDNYIKYKNFESTLKRIGFENIFTVLGNHDYNEDGYKTSGRKAKNAIQQLSDNNSVEIIESHKLILIRINSNMEGALAQGEVGKEQLSEIGNQLDLIPALESYCLIIMLHHHPFELERPHWMRKALFERILGDYFINKSLKLKDSEYFINWLKQRNIEFVLHGHKHIPLLFQRENLNIISAGSSTGSIIHSEKDKTFLPYNVIRYDLNKKRPISASILYEDILGSGSKNYQMVKYAP